MKNHEITSIPEALESVLNKKTKRVHPLINKESTYYKIFNKEAIEQFEKIFTKKELKAWAKISYYKYMFRIGKKDKVTKELQKMQTFKEYYEYLDEQ